MDNESLNIRRRHHRNDDKPHKSNLKLRNWLNIIFMVGAIIGMIFYFFADRTTGIIIILASMIFKMVESALRFFNK